PEGKEPHIGDREARPVDAGTPQLRSLHLAHITATNVHASAGHVFGLPEAPLQDLSLHDVSISFAEQPRPAAPEMALDVPERVRSGIELGFVAGGDLSRVRVRGMVGEPVLTTSCTDLELDVRGSDVHHG
ncbi:MAG: glycoside hydrolase family 28 protein, partial [Brachybacterium sp.]